MTAPGLVRGLAGALLPTSRGHRLLLTLALFLFVGQAALHLTWFVDDAAISFTYARNLGAGHGLVLTPWGERVEAYSNPLWVFLLGACSSLGLNIFASAKVLSILAGVVALAGVCRLGERLSAVSPAPAAMLLSSSSGEALEPPSTPDAAASSPVTAPRFPVGPLAALLAALHPPFVIWATSGLEAGLYVCLLIWATERLLAEAERPAPAGIPWSGLLFCGVALTRPEGILFFALAAGVQAFLARDLFSRAAFLARARGWIGWLLAFGLPWLVYQVWHYLYFASLVTNTWNVKRPETPFLDRLLGGESAGWLYLLNWLEQYRLLVLLPLLALPVVEAALSRRWTLRAQLLCLAPLLGSVFFVLLADGDWMKEYRFMAPVAPWYFLMVSAGLWTLVERLPLSWRLPRDGRPASITLLVFGGVLLLCLPAVKATRDFRRNPEVGVADVKARADFFRAAREALHLEGDVTFMDPDLGATSFFSGMRVVDTWGLADVAFGRHGVTQAFVSPYVFNEVRPDFFHVFGYWNTRTRILEEPRWNTDFAPLPTYRGYRGTRDGGNYVNRAHLRATRVEYPEDRPAMRTYASGLELVHARLDVAALPPGGTTRLTLFWRTTQPHPREVLFASRLQAPGKLGIDMTHLPLYGWMSPGSWPKEEVLKEVLVVRVPSRQASGLYTLEVDVVDRDSGLAEGTMALAAGATAMPSLTVGVESAREELGRMQAEAKRLLALGKAEQATEVATRALSMFPADGATQAVRASCEAQWRAQVLASVERLMGESARQAAQTYAPAYWRWVGQEDVLEVGRRLAMEALARGDRAEKEGRPGQAFEDYLAAVTLDPRQARGRQRAEALRLQADPPLGVAGQTDFGWVKRVLVGAAENGTLTDVRETFVAGEQVISQVFWGKQKWHRTQWLWYDPSGEKRFEQSQSTAEGTPLSFATIQVENRPGDWVLEVRVDGRPVATRRFRVSGP